MSARRARRARQRLESVSFFLLGGLVRALPRRAAHGIGAFLARVAFDGIRLRRSVAVQNVMDRIEPAGGVPEAERIARESYVVLARTFLDLVRLDRIERVATDEVFSPQDVEWFLSLAREGRGGVFVSGHFGNWELGALAIRRLGLPIQVLAADQANTAVNERLKRFRRRAGLETLSARDGVREALRALRRNEFVATLMDQDARGKGLFVEFLGVPAATHTGMLSLAVRTGTPLAPGVMLDEGGSYRFVRGEIWRPRPGVDELENLRDGAAHYNRFLEEQVRNHPENYFWAHRRWKTKAPSAPTTSAPGGPR